jgi:uncharacterized protein (DUF1800 family)
MPARARLTRRDFLRLAGLVSTSAVVAACAPAYARLGGPPEPTAEGPLAALDDGVFSVLNRLTYGPRLAERERAAQMGLGGWIEEQLAPAALDDRPADWRLRQFETLQMGAADLADRSSKLFDEVDRLSVPTELRQATLVRQVYSQRQLYELMVEFWTDHFNISVDKGDCYFLKTVDDREVLRPHALGSFHDLLWASAHSPAMLTYLDNQANNKDAPNENYAREIMELHSLSVEGGYTQQDVMELARALTGWTVKEHFWRGEFTFDASRHDNGPKRVLGLTLEPDGQREAERALDLLAAHPAAASFIAAKLARRFLGDSPPAGIIEKARAAFITTQGDIKAVLRPILLDGLALARAAHIAPKFKRPVNFIVSALRQLDLDINGGPTLLEYLQKMGQAAYGWPTPDGYPDRDQPWTGNLLPRWQFALALLRGEIKGTGGAAQRAVLAKPASLADELARRLLGRPLPAAGRDDLLKQLRGAGAHEADLPAMLAAGLLASPAFQWR